MPIPPDTRAPGDAGHITDHNQIADELTALAGGAVTLAGDLTGTAGAAQVTGTHLASALPVAQGGTGSTARNFAGLLTPTAVKTFANSPYTAAAGEFVPVDTTSGNVTVTLPSAPADLTVVGVKQVIQGGTNTVTIACGGSDVFNKASGATSGTLTLLAQGMLLQYKASGGIWYITADDLALSQIDGRYLKTAPAATGNATTDTAALAAALAVLTAGQSLLFQGSGYLINAPLTPPAGTAMLAARGCTITQATQFKPVFDLFNVANVTIGDGFTLVNGSGPPASAGSAFRGDSGYAYSAGVWANTGGNTIGKLRIKDFAMGVYLNASDGTVNSTGTLQAGNTVGDLEVSGCNHGILYLSQKALRIGNLYVHDHVDSSSGANPMHAIYGTGTTTLTSTDVAVGNCLDVGNTTGCGFQFKYVNGLTVGQITADTTLGLINLIDCFDVICGTAKSVNDQITGTSFTVQKATTQPARLMFGSVEITYGVDNSANGAMVLICDDSWFGQVVVNAMHNTATTNSEISLRGNRITLDGVKLRNSGSQKSYGIGVGVSSAYPCSDCTVTGMELNGYRNLVAVDANTTGQSTIAYNPGAQRNITGDLNYIGVTGGTLAGTYSIARSERTGAYAISGGATATPLPAMETVTLLQVSDGTAFTIAAAAIGAYTGLVHSVAISNTSGGTLGTITWNSAWSLRATLPAPASGDTVVLLFLYDGTHWREIDRTAAAAVTPPDIQWYTTVGTATWTKPAGAVTTEAFVLSGGSGGGSGRRGAATTVRCGGGGGAGATLVRRGFVTADLATATVTVGDGGAGGAAVTADGTSGNGGSPGGTSSFGAYLVGPAYAGGAGGTAAAGAGGVGIFGGGSPTATGGGSGGSASTTGGVGVGVQAAPFGAPGGPSGGGITAADVAGNGVGGNSSYLSSGSSTTFGALGTVDTTPPTTGTSTGIKGAPGGSPGSGAASITTAAQAGASAYANSGAGGAGGGASLNGNNSGAGGKGGSGFVLVISFFQ